MKILVLATALAASLVVGGCQRAGGSISGPPGGSRGRYVAVGIYSPGQMWSQLVRASTPQADPAAANLDDDEQVIVVLDSATGEVRQCGNLSGHCIGLNPWSRPMAEGQGAPARLLKHAQELQEEQDVQLKRGPERRAPAQKNTDSPATSPGRVHDGAGDGRGVTATQER